MLKIFILNGIIAIFFLLVGFAIGQHSNNSTKKLDYIPSCLNCKNLNYYCPEINKQELYHYKCSRYGRFNYAPSICGSHELSKKYKDPIIQCKDCEYYLDDGMGNYFCKRFGARIRAY